VRAFLNGGSPSLEAQLCNLADEIAYNAHDIDDGVRSGLLTIEQLGEVELFDHYRRTALDAYPRLNGRRLLFESIRLMLSDQVYDVIDTTRARLHAAGVDSADAVRNSPPLVAFSDAMRERSQVLKTFLFRNLYRHPQVMETTDRARRVVADLFERYLHSPEELPEAHGRRRDTARAVADYIAGMTDRFAIREHERLFGAVLFP
jgi:dGTPase